VAEATKTTVLVVDDDDYVRLMLAMLFQEQGLAAHVASNGPEALAMYDWHRDTIGLVLLDVRLPGMDGPEVLQELRQRDPSVRCCFITGDTGKFTPEKLLELGAIGVFAKPFEFEGLFAKVKQLLEGEPALQ
jgi:DNA-binding response OmpR family regulator